MAGARAPSVAWTRNVSHRKAPGAISAIALLVRPVRPNVRFISPVVASAMCAPERVKYSSERCGGSKKDIEPRLEDSNEIFEIAAEWYGTYRMTWPLFREQRK